MRLSEIESTGGFTSLPASANKQDTGYARAGLSARSALGFCPCQLAPKPAFARTACAVPAARRSGG